VKKDGLKLCFLSMVLLFGFTDLSNATAQHRNFEMNKKLELRQRRIEEFRAVRQIERKERLEKEALQTGKLQSSPPMNDRASLPPSRPASELNERPIQRFNRLTPEERLALRRQIREAREGIYQKAPR
jgi:hypothetical protein